MSAHLATVNIDCKEPRTLADFWMKVLDWRQREVGADGWIEIGPTNKLQPTLLFALVPEDKSIKNRVHIDISPMGSDQQTELVRLLGLGAKEIDIGQGEQTWIVLADPEGNEFCLLRTPVDS